MEKKDERMNITTEVLTNIKMIKLYAWGKTMLNKIEEKRKNELKVLAKAFIVATFSITSFYFFPEILSSVVFSVYIGTGHTL